MLHYITLHYITLHITLQIAPAERSTAQRRTFTCRETHIIERIEETEHIEQHVAARRARGRRRFNMDLAHNAVGWFIRGKLLC